MIMVMMMRRRRRRQKTDSGLWAWELFCTLSVCFLVFFLFARFYVEVARGRSFGRSKVIIRCFVSITSSLDHRHHHPRHHHCRSFFHSCAYKSLHPPSRSHGRSLHYFWSVRKNIYVNIIPIIIILTFFLIFLLGRRLIALNVNANEQIHKYQSKSKGKKGK